jgi:hypothetical protein
MDIFPSSLSLTHNLVRQFKMFVFEAYYNNKTKQNQAEKNKKKGEGKDLQAQQHDRKYQLLVPSTAMPKGKAPPVRGSEQMPIINREDIPSGSKSSSIGTGLGGSDK